MSTTSGCPDVTTFAPPTYNNACYIGTNNTEAVKNLFSSCCAQSGASLNTTTCYLSCPASNLTLASCYGFGLSSLSPPVNAQSTSSICLGTASLDNASNVTTSASGSASGTASGTASASPTSSKPSKASTGHSISFGAIAVMGLALFGLMV